MGGAFRPAEFHSGPSLVISGSVLGLLDRKCRVFRCLCLESPGTTRAFSHDMEPYEDPSGDGTHLSVEEIEEYLLGRANERAFRSLEDHVRVCGVCRQTLEDERSLIARIRHFLGAVLWSRTHLTEDGPIRLYAFRAGGGCVARIVGKLHDGGHTLLTVEEAAEWCEQSFQAMFPDHKCGPLCR